MIEAINLIENKVVQNAWEAIDDESDFIEKTFAIFDVFINYIFYPFLPNVPFEYSEIAKLRHCF